MATGSTYTLLPKIYRKGKRKEHQVPGFLRVKVWAQNGQDVDSHYWLRLIPVDIKRRLLLNKNCL